MARKKQDKTNERIELEKTYKKLAKRADQRLVRLEQLSKQQRRGFEKILDWGYASAMRSIEHWSGKDANRFNRDMPELTRSLKAKISDIERFLHMISSSISRVKKSYRDRANKINDLYGTKFTWEDLGKFFESERWEKLEEKYGSSTAILTVGEIQKNDEAILSSIENSSKLNLKISNRQVKRAINEQISEYGLGVTDLY